MPDPLPENWAVQSYILEFSAVFSRGWEGAENDESVTVLGRPEGTGM